MSSVVADSASTLSTLVTLAAAAAWLRRSTVKFPMWCSRMTNRARLCGAQRLGRQHRPRGQRRVASLLHEGVVVLRVARHARLRVAETRHRCHNATRGGYERLGGGRNRDSFLSVQDSGGQCPQNLKYTDQQTTSDIYCMRLVTFATYDTVNSAIQNIKNPTSFASDVVGGFQIRSGGRDPAVSTPSSNAELQECLATT